MPDHVLILEVDEGLRTRLEMLLRGEGVTISLADRAQQALDCLLRVPVDVVYCATSLPGVDGFDVLPQLLRIQPGLSVILTGAEAAEAESLADAAFRRGAWDAISSPYRESEVRLSHRRAIDRARAHRATALLRGDLARAVGERPIVAASDSMIELLEGLDRIAGYASSVLLSGERGTGKEGIARAIHAQSPRRNGPFVAYDCAAAAADRVHADLFGRTSESSEAAGPVRRGRIRDAHQGTLYLDDVSRLPQAAQAALLRAIRAEEVEPLGSSKPVPVDVRIVAASSADPGREVEAGRLLGDLFECLDRVRLHVPPLRERREDLPLLVDEQLTRLRNRKGEPIRQIGDGALERLLAYAWPGNLRELEIVIERAALAAGGDILDSASLPSELGPEPTRATTEPREVHDAPEVDLRLKPARRTFEAELIRRALKHTNGNRTHAARLLAISHRSLLYKIKDYDLRD